MVELGCSCVDPAFRQGGVILALWATLGDFMQRNGLQSMVGCARVGMRDGGRFAASLWRQLRARIARIASIEEGCSSVRLTWFCFSMPLSAFPFVSLLTNCVIWTYYGLLRSDMTVLVPNALGILTGTGCILGYHKYAVQKPSSMYAVAAALIAFASVLAFQGNHKLLGSLGCILAVILTGSPLVTLQTVIKEKSTAALPLFTSTAGWLNSCSWSLYGLLVAHDPMVSDNM